MAIIITHLQMIRVETVNDRGFLKRDWKGERQLRHGLDEAGDILQCPRPLSNIWGKVKSIGARIISQFRRTHPDTQVEVDLDSNRDHSVLDVEPEAEPGHRVEDKRRVFRLPNFQSLRKNLKTRNSFIHPGSKRVFVEVDESRLMEKGNFKPYTPQELSQRLQNTIKIMTEINRASPLIDPSMYEQEKTKERLHKREEKPSRRIKERGSRKEIEVDLEVGSTHENEINQEDIEAPNVVTQRADTIPHFSTASFENINSSKPEPIPNSSIFPSSLFSIPKPLEIPSGPQEGTVAQQLDLSSPSKTHPQEVHPEKSSNSHTSEQPKVEVLAQPAALILAEEKKEILTTPVKQNSFMNAFLAPITKQITLSQVLGVQKSQDPKNLFSSVTSAQPPPLFGGQESISMAQNNNFNTQPTPMFGLFGSTNQPPPTSSGQGVGIGMGMEMEQPSVNGFNQPSPFFHQPQFSQPFGNPGMQPVQQRISPIVSSFFLNAEQEKTAASLFAPSPTKCPQSILFPSNSHTPSKQPPLAISALPKKTNTKKRAYD